MSDMNNIKNDVIRVYGAGLAGCEAAWQAANRGMKVELYEMKPEKFTPAHHSNGFAELVCSNSLRSDRVTNGVGLLKEEMLRLGSLIMEAAYATRVPAGSALAVDRDKFSAYIKCIEERKAGNNEFLSAEKQCRKVLEESPLPEVAYFLEHFIPAFELTLDELGTIEE